MSKGHDGISGKSVETAQGDLYTISARFARSRLGEVRRLIVTIDTVTPPYQYGVDCKRSIAKLGCGGAGQRCDLPNPRRESLL